MKHKQADKVSIRPWSWAVVLGLVGFVCGFIGPILLNPGANQGPLMGIFITGPGGLILGGILGYIAAKCELTRRTQFIALASASILTGTLVFIFCVVSVQDKYVGSFVRAEIRKCKDPKTLIPEKITSWKNRLRKNSYVKPREGWEKNVDKMTQEDRGVVLEMLVQNHKSIYKSNKPWDRGKLKTGTARSEPGEIKNFYVRFKGDSCQKYPMGMKVLWFDSQEISRVLPPDILPTFLDLTVLSEIPDQFSPLLRE
jgi:hypothetical protein